MDMRKCAALALSAALLAAPAYADGFAVYETSARGVGMGGAMMFSDEASAQAMNPAAITQFGYKGTFSGAVTYIAPRGYADFYQGGSVSLTQHNKNDPAYVPSLFYAKRVSHNGWFGMGLYARFGLKSSYDPGWYGRFSNRSADFLSYSIAPTYAIKLTPNLSMGVGVELMYSKLVFDKSLNSFAALGISEVPMDLDADSWGWGWNVGLLWNSGKKLSLGATYRSEVKQSLDGDINLSTGYFGDISTTGSGDVHLPESVTIGLGWKFDENTRMEIDAIWTEWSSYDKLAIAMRVPSAYQALFGTTLNSVEYKYWSDGWRYQFGIERRINDRWSVRCGFVWDECSSELADYADYMVPTGTRRTYTVGASYRVKNVEYSFGYGYMTVGGKWINSSGANGENSRSRGCDSHIISIGARVDF